jgi:hypothetical protein
VWVQARGDIHGWVSAVCEHEGGRISEVAISCSCALIPSQTEIALYGAGGELRVDARSGEREELWGTVRRELVDAVRTGEPHPYDARRGLHLQRLVDAVETAITSSSPIQVRSDG